MRACGKLATDAAARRPARDAECAAAVVPEDLGTSVMRGDVMVTVGTGECARPGERAGILFTPTLLLVLGKRLAAWGACGAGAGCDKTTNEWPVKDDA